MVEDKKKEEEDFENGLIDSKTIELDSKFKEAIDTKSVKSSLLVMWESLSYNFGKIRTRQHMNTSAIQKIVFEQKVIDNRIKQVEIKQSDFRPLVEKHIKKDETSRIKNEAQWGLIMKILGGTGTIIVMILAILQLFTLIGGL
jgi:hypothetical protein